MTGGEPGSLLLADGRRFDGILAVPPTPAAGRGRTAFPPGQGEVIFQTGMTGYQEVLTDPSYRGQIVVFTAPHIGNVGVNRADEESPRPSLAGVVLRSLARRPSSWRAEEPLEAWLRRHRVPTLTEVDTRALTRHLREGGSAMGVLLPASVPGDEARRRLAAFPSLEGRDLVREVAPVWTGDDGSSEFTVVPTESSSHTDPGLFSGPWTLRNAPPALAGREVAVIDCGAKRGIMEALAREGARVTVAGPEVSAETVLGARPDLVLVSNGPGDPSALDDLVRTLRRLAGRVPLAGICLGHQLLALALGGRTRKMKYGHHGQNHPVRDLATGRVWVTVHNHGFAVDADSMVSAMGGERFQPTHVSLNDNTLEGFRIPALRVTAVQFHPEARGGPHDAGLWFAGLASLLPTPSTTGDEVAVPARPAPPSPPGGTGTPPPSSPPAAAPSHRRPRRPSPRSRRNDDEAA